MKPRRHPRATARLTVEELLERIAPSASPLASPGHDHDMGATILIAEQGNHGDRGDQEGHGDQRDKSDRDDHGDHRRGVKVDVFTHGDKKRDDDNTASDLVAVAHAKSQHRKSDKADQGDKGRGHDHGEQDGISGTQPQGDEGDDDSGGGAKNGNRHAKGAADEKAIVQSEPTFSEIIDKEDSQGEVLSVSVSGRSEGSAKSAAARLEAKSPAPAETVVGENESHLIAAVDDEGDAHPPVTAGNEQASPRAKSEQHGSTALSNALIAVPTEEIRFVPNTPPLAESTNDASPDGVDIKNPGAQPNQPQNRNGVISALRTGVAQARFVPYDPAAMDTAVRQFLDNLQATSKSGSLGPTYKIAAAVAVAGATVAFAVFGQRMKRAQNAGRFMSLSRSLVKSRSKSASRRS